MWRNRRVSQNGVIKTMEQLTLFKIRDLRKKDQFKIDDAYLNGYARVCGKDATLVYNSLCRHAEFESQKAFPSQEKIAYEHNISVRTVRRGLKKLIDYKIIIAERVREKGKFMNYLYILLDKSEWKSLTSGQNRPMVNQRTKTIGGKTTYGKCPTKDNKVLRITNIKDNKEESSFFKKKKKPFFQGKEMRYSQGRWWVLPRDGSPWLKFAGQEKEIEWK